MKSYAIGVDVGGTTVKMGFFQTDGTVLDKWEIRTRKENYGNYILSDIAASILDLLKKKNISMDEVQGVGIGVPGAVLEGGTVNRCVNLGWDVVPVGKQLAGLLGGMKVEVGNDANVAALGEVWKGGGVGFKDIVMVTLGTGVGGGIILNGKILHGAFGAAGEIGHMPVSLTETETCNCGKKGCLEQYVSATGISRMAREKLASSQEESVLRAYGNPSAKNVFDAAKTGDKLAWSIVDDFGKILGRGLAFVACAVDPQAFVIGGGVSKAGQIILDVTDKYYREYCFHASRDTEFVLAKLGNDAGIYGAVKMVL